MASLNTDQIKVLEQSRQRLVQLTRSLGSLITSLNQSDPLPPWLAQLPDSNSKQTPRLTQPPQVLPPIPSKHYLQQPPQRLRTALRPTHPPLNPRRLPRPRIPRPDASKYSRTAPAHETRPPCRRLGRARPGSRDGKGVLCFGAQRGRPSRVVGVGAAGSERGSEAEELGWEFHA
jgi:hypothetical protein